MRLLSILILAILFINVLCFFRKKHSTLHKKKHHAKTKQLEDLNQEYAQELITKINIYRKEHQYFPEISYSEKLQETGQDTIQFLIKKLAYQEAQNLINQNNFGEHANFQTLRNEVPNEFLTEITLKISYSEELPPADIFCQQVVEAIGQTEERYLSFEYLKGGAYILQNTQDGLYYIVIHLLKDQSSVEIPLYSSCKEALEQGYEGNKIKIPVNSEEKEVTCEQEYAEGGWTMLLEKHEELEKQVIIPIDTMGLKYSEILFKADEGYEFNSRTQDDTQYKFDGFLFQANALRFGETWYVSEEFDINFSYDRDNFKEKSFYKQSEQITVLEPSEICYFEDQNLPQFCAKAFIFNPPLPQGDLNALSDVESLGNYAFQNNKYKANFKLFVR